MVSVIIRHGKVDFPWKKLYSSAQFDKACASYDSAPLLPAEYRVPDVLFSRCYVSTLQRTRDTAFGLFGDIDMTKTPLIDEVPMNSSLDTELRLPLLFWKLSGRLQWLCGSGRQKESRLRTLKRASRFTDLLIKRNEDCVIVSHGFYMHALIYVMKKKGFRIGNRSLFYKNGAYVYAVR